MNMNVHRIHHSCMIMYVQMVVFPVIILWKVAKGNQAFEPELCEAGFLLLQPRVYLVVADVSLHFPFGNGK